MLHHSEFNDISTTTSMPTTTVAPNRNKDYFMVCSFSGFFALTAVVISSMILILTWRSKPRLHTIRHLLICNTSIASIFYCTIQSMNYIFLIFLPWETSDVGCRWRGYLAYVTICGMSFSYLAQSISRLFISLLSNTHPWTTSYRTHYYLIFVQWLAAILAPLPAILTTDIIFRPGALCWVPLKHTLHVSYTYVVYYSIPALSICLIYLFIYYRVRQSTKNAIIQVRLQHNANRDLEVLRNVLILLTIYLAGGIPTLIFLISTNRVFYLIGIVTISLTVAVEKLVTIVLDRELRHVARDIFVRKNRQVAPISNTRGLLKGQTIMTPAPPALIETIGIVRY
uniref:7 transmembrane receptor (Rhodopsin family) B n=1 Tax=Philodina roseola TaxID=96448 RepID=B2L3H8_PHIRO|nr:7 transmembrane receptor (rhodopsin family) B [Philodina roseola]